MIALQATKPLYAATAITAILAFGLTSRAQNPSSDIRVEFASKTLSLHVTMRSKAEGQVTLFRYLLPWGNRNSMVLAAVTAGGQNLERYTVIDDPSPEQITVAPGEAVSGDINLESNFRGLRAALKKSDVHLFWAYRAPDELRIGNWSGGWILIPQQK